jgi:hypothetical protein
LDCLVSRTCLRGWGCEFHDYMPGLVALGSVIWAAIIVVFGGVVYWMGRKGGQTRHFVHWVFLVVMPVWLTWFGWCSFKLVMAKSSNYRYDGRIIPVVSVLPCH